MLPAPWDCQSWLTKVMNRLLFFFCLPVILAGLTKDPLILVCGRLFEDKKTSEGNSNNKKSEDKEAGLF